LPSNPAVTSNTNFKFDVVGVNSVDLECRTYELKAEAFHNQSIVCSATNMPCNVRNSSSVTVQNVTIKKPDIKFSNFTASSTALPPNQEQVDYSFTLSNDGEAVPAGTMTTINVYADNGNGDYDAGDVLLFSKTTTNAIAAGGQTTISGSATVTSGKTCRLLAVLSSTVCNCQGNQKSLIVTPDLKFTTPKDITVCSGGVKSIGPNPMSGVAYQWSSFGGSNINALSSTTTSPVNFSWINATETPLEMRYFFKSIRNGGECYAIDTVKIVVTPAVYDSTLFTVCLNSPFQLAGPTGMSNYQWTPSTNLSATNVANPSVTVIASSIKYKLTYTTPDACSGVYIANIQAIACSTTELGDTVFYDKNYNGIQDIGENGIGNVTVQLFKANDLSVPIMVTMTNASGRFIFGNLPQGEYIVKFIPPSNAILTKQDQGASDAKDSDANPITGYSQSVFIAPGNSNYTLDAGIVYPDWGDAPNSYKTDQASDGPRHLMIPNLKLGTNIDTETNGAPATTGSPATGDDTAASPDDEDAIASFPPISVHKIGQTITVNVKATNNTGTAAQMITWIDFDRNGIFDASEGILTNVPNGSNDVSFPVTFTVPNNVDAGITYARVRLANSGLSTANAGGLVTSGEVEDYNLMIDCETLNNPNFSFLNLCSGSTIPSLTASTNSTRTNGVSFVYFTTQQSGNAVYTGGIPLGTVTPTAGTATLSNVTLPINNGTQPIEYYLYAILNPSSASCKPSVQYRVKVNPLPIASILNPTPIICDSTIVNLEASGGDSYIWSSGDNTAAIVLEPHSTTTYTVTITDANGCTDTEQTTVTVNPLPIVTSGLNTTVCSDVAAGLNLTVTGTSPAAASYDITNLTIPTSLTASAGAPAVANAQAANVIADDAYTNKTLGNLTVNYVVRATSAAGCTGPKIAANVTIKPEPVLATGLDKTVCSDVASAIALNTASTSIAATGYDVVSISSSQYFIR
jgi:SdrD B-like domain/GEVED domain/PKD-like domain